MVPYSIREVPEVAKDLKKIRVNGFEKDYERFKQALPHMVEETDFYRHHGFYEIAGLGKVAGRVFKAKKIHCKSLAANDKFRVIFQLCDTTITLLEAYFKGQKENEDRARILQHCRVD
ncbi:MAG: hypothetical protein NTY90_04995 [Candidatus Micrarchaeota archaeon]|nr:hypothetical protein [Candidatus Micrarchaeota archaeon]